MAGLQRFITYIYNYENEERKQNTGFAKIEIRGNSCRMEVHIRGLLLDKPEGIVYLFARKEKIMQGIPVGNINIQRGNGDVGYVFDTKELVNYGISIGQLEGIMIPLREGSYIASQWKEGEIRESFFRILEKKEVKAEHSDTEEKKAYTSDIPEQGGIHRKERQELVQKPGQEAVDNKKLQPEEMMQKANQQRKRNYQQEMEQHEVKQREMKQREMKQQEMEQQEIKQQEVKQEGEMASQSREVEEEKNQEEKNIHTTEIPLEKLFDDVGWERYFMKLKSRMPICFPFEGEQIECVQMELKDIKELPRKYWYLGNNSFLLHGFFNYQHLLMGEMEVEDEKEYFIGIPGVFQNQEKIMATMFGFPEFKPQNGTEHKTGQFGYWFRVI